MLILLKVKKDPGLFCVEKIFPLAKKLFSFKDISIL